MKIKENASKYFWTGGGIGVFLAVALLGGRYLAAQEAERVVLPVKAEVEEVRVEQQATSELVQQMQFTERNAEVTAERDRCLEADHSKDYCNAFAAWRWDVWFGEYEPCISKVEKYADRIEECGPEPEFKPPEGVEP